MQKLEILFEDDYIVVIHKPAGVLSMGYPGFRGKSAQDILTEKYKNKGKIRIACVHRLDRDTSGVMMYAKSGEAKTRLMEDWHNLVTERIYRCVCVRGPRPLPDSGVIDSPIAYNKADIGFVPGKDDPAYKGAQKAVTRYKVLERGERFDLVECALETGKKNQIRIHLASLGNPVYGDETYGSPAASGAERMALHARVLAFTHPFTGDPHRIEASEPTLFALIVRAKATHTKKPETAQRKTGEQVMPVSRRNKNVPGKSKYIP